MNTTPELLRRLKLDLEIIPTRDDKDELLNGLISWAIDEITAEGITLDSSSDRDKSLAVSYAAHLYRIRASTDPDKAKMPRFLRLALNNRKFAQAMAEEVD
jgi:hypothetical protein